MIKFIPDENISFITECHMLDRPCLPIVPDKVGVLGLTLLFLHFQ
jgi:hypothetical protein